MGSHLTSVEVWLAEAVLHDKEGRRQSLIKTCDTREEAIAYLNSPRILRLLAQNQDNRGAYWNLADDKYIKRRP